MTPNIAHPRREPGSPHATTIIEVISARDVSVFEVGEYQGCFGEVADPAWAGGDVLEYPPAADQEREATLALAA
jgi:hypothetical protein